MHSKKFSGFSVEHWNTMEEDTQLKTPIFDVVKRRSVLPSENLEGDFYILSPPDWINVVATTPDMEFITVEQYRHGVDQPTLEIPGGMVDPDETPFEASKRELLEETGYHSEDWVELGSVEVNPAIQTNKTFTYWARNCKKTSEQSLDQHERIKIGLIPEKEFLALVSHGTVTHSLVVAAVAKYLLYN